MLTAGFLTIFPVMLLDVILIIVLIVFARRHKNDPKYTAPIIPDKEN